jgi:O-antigen ligase
MYFKILNPKNIELENIKNILIFFFVFTLIFSRSFADLIIVISSISFVYLKIKKKIEFHSKFFLAFLFFYIYLLLNSFFSEVPHISFRTSLPYIRFAFCIFFFLIFFSDKNSLKTLLFSFFFFYLLLFFDAIFQNSLGFNLLGYPLDESGRISSFFNKELILGSFVSKTFAIVIFLIFYLKIEKKYLLYFSTTLITFILVYLSKERSSMLFYLIILFFSFFLIEKKYFFRVVMFIFFKIFLIIFIYSNPLDRLYYHTKSQLFESKKKISFFSKRHELHYLTAFRIFKKFPIIGSGVNSFRYLCKIEPYSVNDIILNDPDNKVLAPFDGYFYFIKNARKIKEISYDYVLYFEKSFFEKNKIKNFDNDQILRLIENKHLTNLDLHRLRIYPNTTFLAQHNNFTFIEKDKTLFISYEFRDGCNTHPHHLFLQILAETGILGFIFLCFFYIFIIKLLFKRILEYMKLNVGTGKPDLIVYAYYFALLFPLMSSGNFFNNYYSILLYLPLTYILLCQRKQS